MCSNPWIFVLCAVLFFSEVDCYRMRFKGPNEWQYRLQVSKKCQKNEFLCEGVGCMSEDFICDGKVDCPDATDEKKCFYFPCPKYAFKCTYGACISPDLVCDGHQDCKDNSDETENRCGVNPDNIYGNCSRLQFGCKSGECIDDIMLCDGRQDCEDESDEATAICSLLRCPEYAFRCDNGACINSDHVCDNTRNCFDGSDERNCASTKKKCSFKEFQCESGECIDDFDLCDGLKNCRDSSDETINVCARINCPLYAFQCRYGGCIDAVKRCNGMQDCVDGSDEMNCIPSPPQPTPGRPTAPPTTDGWLPTVYTTSKTTQAPRTTTRRLPTDRSNLCRLPDNIINGFVAKKTKVYAYPDGDYVPQFKKIRFGCDNGYVLHPPNASAVCTDEWTSLPVCLKTCADIQTAHSRNVTCTLNNEIVSCVNPPQGTRAAMACTRGYHDANAPYAPSYVTTHQGRQPIIHYRMCYDGAWDNPLLDCIPSAR